MYMTSLGFVEAKSNTSLFVFRYSTNTIYLLFYVDDIVLIASSATLLQQTISVLKREFAMKDLEFLHHFLRVSVQYQADVLFLTHRQFALDILEWASMVDYKPVSTPVDTQAKVSTKSGPPVADPTQFRSLTGALQYLIFIHLDITYATQHIFLHMHDPRESHLTAMKHTLCYLQGTLDYGILLWRSASSELTVYTDIDLAGCLDTRWSTSGYAVFLDTNLVSWYSKHQNVVSRSSAEAEYRTMANGVAEACWLWQLLQELHAPLMKSIIIYCDNVSTIYLSTNPIQHQRTKHIEIDLHFMLKRVVIGDVRVLHVSTISQFTEIFTNGLPTSVFSEFWSSLNIHSG
jgi:hypothetical protein